ncbi:MAG: radical SAM protein [Oscillospiraceae bacterium]|nr:radical SAM protein [Oscillospiraceae bacterium]
MNREYIYHSFTRTICSACGELVDGKIAYNDKGVFVLKNCGRCGDHFEILEEDYKYHLSKNKYDKRGTVSFTQTKTDKGCPYDCGLCERHDQHTCIGLIEITKKCDLNCPMCYAGHETGGDIELDLVEKMMDFYMTSENNGAEILQISGGEPALHKDAVEIIKMAKNKGFKYVMLNTNGTRIAEDEDFVRELSDFRGGFEIYLQFDGLDDEVYAKLRGKNLSGVKKRAIAALDKYNIPTTLVATIEKGVNDHLCGEILVYGMNQPCVRGVNFQPVSYYKNGRPAQDRVTLSGVLNRIEKQTGEMIRTSDFIPLPCNAERVAITYLFKDKKGFVPITRNNDLSEFKDFIGNTFVFTVEDTLKNFSENSRIFNIGSCCNLINDIKKYLPKNFILKSKEEKMKFVDENTFRISVSSFVDKYNFDMKSMQKECVHIITPDFKRIPFSAYNMLHRGKGKNSDGEV